MMCPPSKMLSHCCTPIKKNTINTSPAKADRGESPPVPGRPNLSGSLLMTLVKTEHFSVRWPKYKQKTGAQHADASLGGEGCCWGEEIPPPASDTHRHGLMTLTTPPSAGCRENCVREAQTTTNQITCYCFFLCVKTPTRGGKLSVFCCHLSI